MPLNTILITLLALFAFGYFIGRKRSIAVATTKKGRRNLHSLPQYYGFSVAIWAGLPSLIVLLIWVGLNSTIVNSLTIAGLPDQVQTQSQDQLGLLLNEIAILADGDIDTETDAIKRDAAHHYVRLKSISSLAMTGLVFSVAYRIAQAAILRTLISKH